MIHVLTHSFEFFCFFCFVSCYWWLSAFAFTHEIPTLIIWRFHIQEPFSVQIVQIKVWDCPLRHTWKRTHVLKYGRSSVIFCMQIYLHILIMVLCVFIISDKVIYFSGASFFFLRIFLNSYSLFLDSFFPPLLE